MGMALRSRALSVGPFVRQWAETQGKENQISNRLFQGNKVGLGAQAERELP